MPKRKQLFEDMAGDNSHAVVLVAQVGGMPNELQLILETAQYDIKHNGLRPQHNYIVRVLGVTEHHIANIGTTVTDVTLTEDHPLLYEYNTPPTALFFRGKPKDSNAIVLDIIQAYSEVFGSWRYFPDYIHIEKPLYTLFEDGGGLLGQMPKPLANKLATVLEAHNLETKQISGEHPADAHHKLTPQQQNMKVLLIGASYFISRAFSIDELGKT